MLTLKLINRKNFEWSVPILGILFTVTSCGVSQTSGTQENDGIYYDPSNVQVEEKVVIVEDQPYQSQEPVYDYPEEKEKSPVRIGGVYFDETGNAPEETAEPEEKSKTTVNNYNIYTDNNDYVEWGDNDGVNVYINNYGNNWGWGG